MNHKVTKGTKAFYSLAASRLQTVVLILMCIVLNPVLLQAQESGYVRYVIDGDTVILKNGQKIRLIGIDTPEIAHEGTPAEPFGYDARNFTIKTIGSQKIRIAYDIEKKDHYGRHLAYLFLPDGTFVNRELLVSGLATCLHKSPNIKYADLLLRAQRKAMTAQKGIWHGWRENNVDYIGNRRSKRFHLLTCSFGKKTSPKNRALFESQWDAYWQGYSPCSRCSK